MKIKKGAHRIMSDGHLKNIGRLDFRRISDNNPIRKVVLPDAEDITTDADDYIRLSDKRNKRKGPVTLGEIERGQALNKYDIY